MFPMSIRVLATCLAEKPAACNDASPSLAYAWRSPEICTTLDHRQATITGAQAACCGVDAHQPAWQRHRFFALGSKNTTPTNTPLFIP